MTPEPNPPEQTTLAALGLDKPLPPGTGPELREEVREIQDTAAMTWLALTELQPAPDSIWQGIRQELKLDVARPVPANRMLWKLRTWGGWAAAALLALAWWLQESPRPAGVPATVRTPEGGPIRGGGNPHLRSPAAQAGSATLAGGEPALRQELDDLRQRLAEALRQPESPGLHRPAILELRAPGNAGAGGASAREAAARLQQLVTQALQRDLMLKRVRDSSALILESGWPRAGWISGDSGQTIRHLSFPADHWEELGLWKAPDQFYDPATSLTWSPAPDGLGYLGRVSPSAPDPAGFQMPRPREAVMEAEGRGSAAPPAPSGYLVSEPGTSEATLLLADLPPATPGTQHLVVATAADGSRQQYQLHASDFFPFEGNSTGTASLTLSSLSLPGHFTGFSVVQIPTNGAFSSGDGQVLLSGGMP